MATALYSGLHFLVDFACAHAMFRLFTHGPEGYANILLYNFCAFALQMPLGTIMDSCPANWKRLPAVVSTLGVMLTILGSFTHPIVLGLGNALFHVGGGVDVIREDHSRKLAGRALGVFVAPGALGLYIGTQLAASVDITLLLSFSMILLTIPLFFLRVGDEVADAPSRSVNRSIALVCCFVVVILRSYVGMAVAFPWKQTLGLGLAAVISVVLGKAAGGLCAARFGTRNTVVVSLVLAISCYFLGNHAVFGVGALFFFNMTMPITLYQLVLRFPKLPGFCFGLLTFGLFLGFLPVYWGVVLPVTGMALGAAGSLLSLALLLPVTCKEGLCFTIR